MADPPSGQRTDVFRPERGTVGTPLPSGTVTFVLTDIAGSTALWDRAPDAMRPALARHDELVGGAVERHGGLIVRSQGAGDSHLAVFLRAEDAVAAARAI